MILFTGVVQKRRIHKDRKEFRSKSQPGAGRKEDGERQLMNVGYL